jgi:putative salt-induced outer membrane protein YdiY
MPRYFFNALALVIAASACAHARSARADLVRLDNGDRLSGRIEHMSGATLRLKTTYAGSISLPWKRVVSVVTDAPVNVILKNSDRILSSRLLSGPAGRIVLESGAVDVAPAQVAYINPTPAESGHGASYSGRAMLSATSASGNSSNGRLYAQGELTIRARMHRYHVRLQAEQASDSGQETASNWLASGRFDRFVDKRSFFYGRTSFQNDRRNDLRLRSTLGGGYGFQFYETERTKLSLGGGLDYVAVDHETEPNERYPAAGWSFKFSHRLGTLSLELFHDEDGYLSLTNTKNMTVLTRSGLRMPLTHDLNASLQLNANWDRNPGPGLKPIDTTLLLGLSYGW